MPAVKNIFCALFLIMLSFPLPAQNEQIIMCYNVENMFDNKDDSLYNDSEYLWGGIKGWNYERYRQKLSNIAKTIIALGQWTPPAIIGLCEIENANVLNDLIYKTGLNNIGYKFVQYDSPDVRGIDVAMLYQPNLFKVINSHPIKVLFPNSYATTRDILYISGKFNNSDTLHIFINHFPSRLGGELESEPRRLNAAQYLRNAVDSVLAIDSNAAVLIMGDFNDFPNNDAITKTLNAIELQKDTIATQLYNLSVETHRKGEIGTYKHNTEWGVLDQMIVSGALLNNSHKLSVLPQSFRVFAPDWLMEDDKTVGLRPFRTYIGMTYNNGYSDHLPVFVKIKIDEE
jgi:predicted extracellular nuclease